MIRSSAGLILLAGLLFLSACNEDAVGPQPVRPSFSEGQWWIYVWEASLDTSGTPDVIMRDSILIQVVSTSAELQSVSGLICVEAYSLQNPSPAAERVWYRHSMGTLQEVAYQSANALPVVHMRGLSDQGLMHRPSVFDPLSRYTARASPDSIIWRDDPRIILQYPLEPGAQWTAFTIPFRQTRTVEEIRTADLSDGTSVRAASISTRLDLFGENDTWIDVISTRGMISRSLQIQLERTDDQLQPVGTAIHRETLTLAAMSG